jgi:RNA polymerase sigma-70 factor (ECF subfamily)
MGDLSMVCLMSEEQYEFREPVGGVFATTHWSVVLAAREGGAEAAGALEALCRAYWSPLYAFVRRRGQSPHDAQDLTQEFFARLLESDFLQAVERGKGRFRSFLLAALEHFLAKEWRRANAIKRGRGIAFLPLFSMDEENGAEYVPALAAAGLTPEQVYDRQWANTVLTRTIGRLREEYLARGEEAFFDELKIYLTGERQAGRYAELAAQRGMTEAALKMAVSRMRRRYGTLLREEVAQTVAHPSDIAAELQALLAALST